MKEWVKWECKVSFPRLQYLCIKECPKLKEVSEQLFHIKKLEIEKCGSIKASWFVERNGHAVSNTCLEELSIDSCPKMNIPKRCRYDSLVTLKISCGSCESLTTFSLDLFPKLSSLDLHGCHNLRMITQEHTHNHLERLNIVICPIESFPNEGLSAPCLETFAISALKQLKSLPERMNILLPSLTDLEILDCPKVEMLSEGRLPSNLRQVRLSSKSMKLIASLKGTLGPNTCLHTLLIFQADVECFPEEGLLPLSLTTLFIGYCPNIKKLDYKGLCNLSSLKDLRIYDCPNLECLPEEGLPKSISSLTTLNCPLLKQRCQKPEGEDWGKIAHIQNLSIW